MFDLHFMRLALRFARRGYGTTSPNPTVGAVLVKRGRIIGRGRTAPAGGPHAEIGALQEAQRRGASPRGATLYVTLEPCCTHGRTPPCTEALIAAGVRRVVVGAVDPNPNHAGKGFGILRRAGIEVVVLGGKSLAPEHRVVDECTRLNEAFNHWIVHRTPFVTVKAAMTLDGKIATADGESKWITGGQARAQGMKLRLGSDAILVGINTVLADDPSLTCRPAKKNQPSTDNAQPARLRRIVLDSRARTPLNANVVRDEHAALTTIVVSRRAPPSRMRALAARVNVLIAPLKNSAIDLRWLLTRLGSQEVTSLLVEGGGEVNASFLLGGLAQRVAFFYAPRILGGRKSRRGVAGEGVGRLTDVIRLRDVAWRRVGTDLLLTARVDSNGKSR
jgi:diaminohydroxyphosphoribosylaminopyrimidine deaminase/5-amino-6-(5-phosphoribosylamino)uracil reductase